MTEQTGLKIIFSSNISDFTINNNKTAISVYRIFREAITNILRHSGATVAKVILNLEKDFFTLEITDNGKGFNIEISSTKTLGIIGMKERAAILDGELIIESSPGSGCRVFLKIPLNKFN